MSDNTFDTWLKAYGKAWQEKDIEAFVALFSEDAHYYWSPFEEPKVGHEEIAESVKSAVSIQEDIHFHYAILTASGFPAVAHYRTNLIRTTHGRKVTIDGIMTVEFDDDGLCRVFREWWHNDEDESVAE